MKFKFLLIMVSLCLGISSCTVLGRLISFISPSPFTVEQCKKVEQNFDKLKVGMTKKEIIPLIGGKRRVRMIFSPGKFPIPGTKRPRITYDPQQKTPWEVWVLCNNPEKPLEWFMIAFDTKTDKVVEIFSGMPDLYGFD